MLLPIMILLASMTTASPAPVATSTPETHKSPQTLSQYVRQYFADEPILADIAWCESRMRQVAEDGDIFRGIVNPDDIGVMQINTRFHGKKAEALGIDLYTLSGNLEYAKYLFEKEGTKPWSSSQACWGKLARK